MRLFKKGPSKEQKRESNRRWAIVTEQLYPLLLKECKSVTDMKRRLEYVLQAVKNETVVKVEAFKKELEDGRLYDWNIKPLDGGDTKVEQAILDILGEEKITVVDQILTHFPRIIDSFIQEEMSKRSPDTLEIKFPNI